MKLKILLKFAIISAISVTVFSGRAQQLTATTDTNGNFTWPTLIPAAQIGGWTNPIYIYNTNGQLSGTINPNGSFLFTNSATSNSFSYGIQSGVVIIQTPSGSQIFSNGDVYGTIGGSIPLTSTVTNLVAQNTTLQAALLNLSNQVFASFSASNATVFTALVASNLITQTALTNNLIGTSNALWTAAFTLIGTNGINATNYALTIGYQGTNYSYALTTNNGALFTNLVYALEAAQSNNVNGTFTSTNWFATHFRTGVFANPSPETNGTVIFYPGFADANFLVFLSPSTGSIGSYPPWSGGSPNTPNFSTPNGYPASYTSFYFDCAFASPSAASYNYLIFHP